MFTAQTDYVDSTGESPFENTGQHYTTLRSAVSKSVAFLCVTILCLIDVKVFDLRRGFVSFAGNAADMCSQT